MGKRVDDLVARLTKGARKTADFFGGLTDEQLHQVLYESPLRWTLRDVLAHFLSAEVALLRVGQDIAAGGPGAPEGFDYDEFNAQEQVRLAGLSPAALLVELAAARAATIAWLSRLEDAELDRMGLHPALGRVNLETLINAIYGHQLMHARDIQRLSA